MTDDLGFFEIAIVNDILTYYLAEREEDIKRILDNKFACRIKNLKKATNAMVDEFDERYKFTKEDAEEFGKLCDIIKEGIDNFLKK